MLWLLSGLPESNCWFCFSISGIFGVKSSSLFHLCSRLIFMFSEMLHWWVRNPSRGLNRCLVYTTAELRASVVATLSTPLPSPLQEEGFYWPFQDCFCSGLLFLYFGLCMYVLVIFFILDSRLCVFFFFGSCPFGSLLVVFWSCLCFKCVLFPFGVLGERC